MFFCRKALNRIKRHGMNVGQPLHGALSSCNKWKNKKMRLRIVFREIHSKVEVIQIVVIGKRDKKAVYLPAENRMHK